MNHTSSLEAFAAFEPDKDFLSIKEGRITVVTDKEQEATLEEISEVAKTIIEHIKDYNLAAIKSFHHKYERLTKSDNPKMRAVSLYGQMQVYSKVNSQIAQIKETIEQQENLVKLSEKFNLAKNSDELNAKIRQSLGISYATVLTENNNIQILLLIPKSPPIPILELPNDDQLIDNIEGLTLGSVLSKIPNDSIFSSKWDAIDALNTLPIGSYVPYINMFDEVQILIKFSQNQNGIIPLDKNKNFFSQINSIYSNETLLTAIKDDEIPEDQSDTVLHGQPGNYRFFIKGDEIHLLEKIPGNQVKTRVINMREPGSLFRNLVEMHSVAAKIEVLRDFNISTISPDKREKFILEREVNHPYFYVNDNNPNEIILLQHLPGQIIRKKTIQAEQLFNEWEIFADASPLDKLKETEVFRSRVFDNYSEANDAFRHLTKVGDFVIIKEGYFYPTYTFRQYLGEGLQRDVDLNSNTIFSEISTLKNENPIAVTLNLIKENDVSKLSAQKRREAILSKKNKEFIYYEDEKNPGTLVFVQKFPGHVLKEKRIKLENLATELVGIYPILDDEIAFLTKSKMYFESEALAREAFKQIKNPGEYVLWKSENGKIQVLQRLFDESERVIDMDDYRLFENLDKFLTKTELQVANLRVQNMALQMQKVDAFLTKVSSKPVLDRNEIKELIKLEKELRARRFSLESVNISYKDQAFKEIYLKFFKLLSNNPEFRNLLAEFWDEADQFINLQKKKNEVSSEDFRELIKLKGRINDVIELLTAISPGFKSIQTLINLKDNELIPLINRKKNQLKTSKGSFVTSAALEEGIASLAARKAFLEIATHKDAIAKAGTSSHDVFILGNRGIVLKKTDLRASEEAYSIKYLMNILTKQGLVPSREVRTPLAYQLGLDATTKLQMRRGYAHDQIDLELEAAIAKKLTPYDERVWRQYYSTKIYTSSSSRYENLQFSYKNADNDAWKQVSFKELQSLYIKDKIGENAFIKLEGVAKRFQEWLHDSEFATALNKPLERQDKLTIPHFVPILDTEGKKQAYEKCEQVLWKCKDKAGIERTVNFKTLQTLFLTDQLDSTVDPKPVEAEIEDSELKMALNISWGILSGEIITAKGSPLTRVVATPFIDMHIISNANETYLNRIFERMTPESEFQAILTGELQFLDMHAANLGVAPEPNEEYMRFKDLIFRVEPTNITFKFFLEKYLKGEIPQDEIITYTEGETEISKPLRELPDLLKALNVPWKFVIFDTDISLGEDNDLSIIGGSLVLPLRSCLLEGTFKDKPISDECLQMLMNRERTDLQVKQWSKKEDAPILKQLSNRDRTFLKSKLTTILEKYSLSEFRKSWKGGTLKALREAFAKEISDVNKFESIWKLFGSTAILKGDTFESIAKRVGITVDTLKKLNPNQSEPLTRGGRIKIPNKFMDKDPKERLKIAEQLFPRLTVRQQEALFQRQERRAGYLKNYQELKKEYTDPGQLMGILLKFARNDETNSPLNTLEQEDYQRQLVDIQASGASPEEKLVILKQIQQKMLGEVKPTYLNLMKAMYPLLADGYALNLKLYTPKQAGQYIGFFGKSLVAILKEAKEKDDRDDDRDRLVRILERKILAKQNPYFW